MFNFLKKKNVNSEKIKAFNGAVKAINIFILISEWEKAKKALTEIEIKEKESLATLLEKIDKEDFENSQSLKEKQLNIFNKKMNKLKKLKLLLLKKEKQYNDKIKDERFKIRFIKIKNEISSLTGNKKNDAALALLQKFYEENKDNTKVIKLYNKEKQKIIKNKEKIRLIEENKLKDNAKAQALKLIGQTFNIDKSKEKKEKKESFFSELKEKLNFYKNLKEKIRKKKLLDEVNLLIEEDSKVKNDLAARKLANIHKGLIKELSNNEMEGYELYGKILGADKISGDTFGFNDNKEKYNFFLGDATGHGIRAGFIITLLSRLFNKYVNNKNIGELCFEINNGLKQDLKSRNFITGIFFEIIRTNIEKINFVGMGHEPMLIYRSKEQKVEKVIPGGLAAGIRLIKKVDDIKVKDIILNNNDILITYSDGIIENKNVEGEFYGLDKLEESFKTICAAETDIKKIYEYIISSVQIFRGGTQFDDDASVLILKRDINKDIQDNKSDYLKNLKIKEGLKNKDIKKLEGKNIDDIKKELENIKKEKETKRIIKILEGLYETGEILKLKQESIKYIKEGFIDKKINFYLKKAIENEKKYKIEQKEIKIKNKYNVLKELYKKGDLNTVISEIEEIIAKDGNI